MARARSSRDEGRPLSATTETATPRPPGADPTLAYSKAAKFEHVDVWVFDLDNTLYPAGSDLWPKIDDRITHYLANLMGIDGISARALQKYYYQRHGTTLQGLVDEHPAIVDDFLAFVHDIDRSSLAPDVALGAAIGALPGRKLILTNGSRDHALKTAAALGIGALFEDVFDIAAADLVAKPHPGSYQRFFDRHAVDPRRAAMFEDLARNLVVPHARGMTTTLVVPSDAADDTREAWESTGGEAPHIDFVTNDLAGFLGALMRPVP